MQDLQNLPERDKAELQNFIRNETQKSAIQQSKISSSYHATAMPLAPTFCPLLTLLTALYILVGATVRPAKPAIVEFKSE